MNATMYVHGVSGFRPRSPAHDHASVMNAVIGHTVPTVLTVVVTATMTMVSGHDRREDYHPTLCVSLIP